MAGPKSFGIGARAAARRTGRTDSREISLERRRINRRVPPRTASRKTEKRYILDCNEWCRERALTVFVGLAERGRRWRRGRVRRRRPRGVRVLPAVSTGRRLDSALGRRHGRARSETVRRHGRVPPPSGGRVRGLRTRSGRHGGRLGPRCLLGGRRSPRRFELRVESGTSGHLDDCRAIGRGRTDSSETPPGFRSRSSDLRCRWSCLRNRPASVSYRRFGTPGACRAWSIGTRPR